MRPQNTAAAQSEGSENSRCNFDIYRSDQVRLTSTRFEGGDWHWRLADAEGSVLLDAGGYASARECLSAIAVLQENAGLASVSRLR